LAASPVLARRFPAALAVRASTASAPAPLHIRHFLIGCAPIKNARNSTENNALNFSNRLKNACFGARFSQVLRPGHHGSRFTNHQSLLTNHAFLIVTQLLDIELTRSQQTRQHFLIATFPAVSRGASCGAPGVRCADKTERSGLFAVVAWAYPSQHSNRPVDQAMPTTPAASPAQALESGTFYSDLHPTEGTATINAQSSSLAAAALGKAEPAAPKGKTA
jgi:hypothetical protein